ncbi:hypothetical protein ONZ45_g1846 [Pleurotus djamor]|nr:hypothetical protein ONZ45_g1846 [Pleurotus djamor]
MSFFRVALRSAVAPRRTWTAPLAQNQRVFRARFSDAAHISKPDIESRILDVLKSFEKVDPTKVSPTASFSKDLGLDSLDAVELVMSIEEEFSIEIPDQEADSIQTVAQAIEYIAKTPEAQ